MRSSSAAPKCSLTIIFVFFFSKSRSLNRRDVSISNCRSCRFKKKVLKAGVWIRIYFCRIRIQSLMLEANTDPDPIRIQGFNDKKLEKITAENFFLYGSNTDPDPLGRLFLFSVSFVK